ncbi:MAG: PAS domain-containing protein, partial [Gallionella sp.]
MNRAEFVALLQRNNGWKLWSSVVLITILVVEAIVATLDIIFYGHIIMDDMIKGFVATAIVEPTHLLFMVFMLGEFAKAERRSIQLSEQHANSRLNIAIEHTEMIVWEMDFLTNELRYEDELLRLFGMPEGTVARDLQSWLALVHEEDRERFVALYQQILTSSDGSFDYEYRLLHAQGLLC